MEIQSTLRNLVNTKFNEVKSRNGRYSLRSYANNLGISCSALSEFLNGHRTLSKNSIKKVLMNLEISKTEQNKLLNQINIGGLKNKLSKKVYVLEIDQYKVLSDWTHFAILVMTELADFQSNLKTIASRLGVSRQRVSLSVSRLKKLNLLKDVNGKLQSTNSFFSTSDEVSSEALKFSHSNNLDLAKQSILSDPIDRRDFTASTMAIHPDNLPKAKECIRKFHREMAKILETDPKTEVYKLCVQLYPLTKRNSDEEVLSENK